MVVQHSCKEEPLCDKCKTVDSRLAFSTVLHIPLKWLADHMLQLLHCIGFTWQGWGEVETAGLASCKKCVRQSRFQLAAEQTHGWSKLNQSAMLVVLL